MPTPGQKDFLGIGNFFSSPCSTCPDGFLQMIFIDTNGFDRHHYKFDYVRREFLGECVAWFFDVTRRPKRERPFLGRVWVEDQNSTLCVSTALTGEADTPVGIPLRQRAHQRAARLVAAVLVYSEEKDLHYARPKKPGLQSANALWDTT